MIQIGGDCVLEKYLHSLKIMMLLRNLKVHVIYVVRRSVRDLKSETGNDSKTRLYQSVHTAESLLLIVELAITR